MRQPASVFLWIVLAAFIAACAGLTAPPPSRYIGSLEGLESQRDPIFDEYHLRPGVELGRYQAVQILPIEISKEFDKYDERDIRYTKGDLEYVSRYFRAALDEALSPRRAIVEAARPGALQIRILITRLEPNVIPQNDLVDDQARTSSVGFGYAGAQLTLSDAESGEVVAAIVAGYRGRDASLRSSRTWGDAEHAFRLWSRELAKRLE